MELITLQGIFADSFEQIDDDTIKFTFQSEFYKEDFYFTIQYSENYPQEPLKKIEISTSSIHKDVVQIIYDKLRSIEKEMLNEDQPYIFQLVNSLDDDNFQVQNIARETKELQEQKQQEAEDDDN